MNLSGRFVRRLALAALLLFGLDASCLAGACAQGGCVQAGPRLASVDSTKSPLLNALLGSLLGTTVNVTAADWNTVATANVSMNNVLAALQTTVGAASPQTALTTPITLGQLSGAISTAASQAGNTSLVAALGNITANVNVPGTITLGDLVKSDGVVGNTQVNALSLIMGGAQLFNSQNVATTGNTPVAIDVPGSALGLSGSLTSVKISAQVVEPPVYVCGPTGSQFHSAAIRVKLAITLVSVNPTPSSALNILLGGTLSVTLGNLPIYLEIARADGAIGAVNAIANTMGVSVTPGVAALYIGDMDNVFFNRSHVIDPTLDLQPAPIGALTLLGLNASINAKAAAVGSGTLNNLTFSGTTLQTQTASSGGTFASTLVTSLFSNLQLTITPNLGIVGTALSGITSLVANALSPVLSALVTSVVNPLLSALGIRLGEVDVTSGGEYISCALAGCIYADANHNVRQDSGELGTGAPLYAKVVPTATPTAASTLVTVDPATGNYSFTALTPGTYTLVVNGSNLLTTVTGAPPAGWVGTEQPTQSRSVTLGANNLAGQNFGLYHGSSIAGSLFKDTGVGSGGVANNGVKDGTEAALGGVTVKATDPTGATLYDTQVSDAGGAYVLWIPYTVNGAALKVAQAADPAMVVVAGKPGTSGGTFTSASASVGFTFASGSAYTGVNFGDVPINRLDTDGQQSAAPGTTALYAHAFHAGSAGQVTFAAAPLTTAPTGWSGNVYLDANCNGQLDTGETLLAAATPVIADQTLCVVVKVFVPLTATNEMRTTYQLTSSFTYANNTLTGQVQRQDLTIVGTADDLRLVKTVDKTSALSGDVITYTLTFVNQGAAAVSGVKVRDATPAWTVLSAAACGTMPTGISGCSVSATPAVGAAGSVEWTLTGSLPSGGTGSVQFSVKVQ